MQYRVALAATIITLAGVMALITRTTNADIYTNNAVALISAVEIAAGGSTTSSTIDLTGLMGDGQSMIRPDGYFGVQVLCAGDGAGGTVKLEYLCSIDGVTFTEPTGAVDIATGLTTGTTYHGYAPPLCRYLQIKVTETVSSDTAKVTVWTAVD